MTVTLTELSRPRSGHAWCRGGNSGGIYLFGGEFSSPKQGTFYHYNDVSCTRRQSDEKAKAFPSFGGLSRPTENGRG